MAIIKNLPTIEAEPVEHGWWIKLNDDDSAYRCSACGEISCCKSNYCGDCGAKMEPISASPENGQKVEA